MTSTEIFLMYIAYKARMQCMLLNPCSFHEFMCFSKEYL